MQQVSHPIVKWAQRKDKVFLEIGLRDISNEKLDLTETSINFKGTSDGKEYAFDFELFAAINTEESKWNKTGFHMLVVLQKKEADQPFWTRVTKSPAKNQYIQIDWSKWVDEDEEEEEGDKGLGGLDPSQMQGFPGMGGMGGMPGMGMPGMEGMGGMGMPGMGGMGMPGMGGMGGFPGMGGDEDDEDEGNIDDLDKPEEVEEKASG